MLSEEEATFQCAGCNARKLLPNGWFAFQTSETKPCNFFLRNAMQQEPSLRAICERCCALWVAEARGQPFPKKGQKVFGHVLGLDAIEVESCDRCGKVCLVLPELKPLWKRGEFTACPACSGIDAAINGIQVPSKEQQVEAERSKGYGPLFEGHKYLGESWRAILQEHWQKDCEPIPPHVVCLMLTALKVHRAAKPFNFREDDYVDGHNYFDFARRLDPQNPEFEKGIKKEG